MTTLAEEYKHRIDTLRDRLLNLVDVKKSKQYPIETIFPDYIAQSRLLNRTRILLTINNNICRQLDELFLLEKKLERQYGHVNYQSRGYPEGYLCPESKVWR